MGNGISGDQGNLPSYGKRDVGITFDRKQHDWSEPARAQEVNTLMSNVDPYKVTVKNWHLGVVGYKIAYNTSLFDFYSASA